MARTARATKLVIQDNSDGRYRIKGGGAKIWKLTLVVVWGFPYYHRKA